MERDASAKETPGGRAYDLDERLLGFAVQVLGVVDSLARTRAGNHAAGQLVRSGTSPAANYAEAQSAESKKDFVHKLKIVLKELRETRIWLLLAQRCRLVRAPEAIQNALQECLQLIAIFQKSITTAENNRNGASGLAARLGGLLLLPFYFIIHYSSFIIHHCR